MDTDCHQMRAVVALLASAGARVDGIFSKRKSGKHTRLFLISFNFRVSRGGNLFGTLKSFHMRMSVLLCFASPATRSKRLASRSPPSSPRLLSLPNRPSFRSNMATVADRPVPQVPQDTVSSLSFGTYANTPVLASGSWSKKVSVWTLTAQGIAPATAYEHEAPVLSVQCDSANGLIFSAGCDNVLRAFDPNANQSIVVGQHAAAIKDCRLLPSLGAVVTGGWDKAVRYWDPRSQTKAPVAELALPGKVYSMDAAGNLLVIGMENRLVGCVDVRNPTAFFETAETPHEFQVCHHVFIIDLLPLYLGPYASALLSLRSNSPLLSLSSLSTVVLCRPAWWARCRTTWATPRAPLRAARTSSTSARWPTSRSPSAATGLRRATSATSFPSRRCRSTPRRARSLRRATRRSRCGTTSAKSRSTRTTYVAPSPHTLGKSFRIYSAGLVCLCSMQCICLRYGDHIYLTLQCQNIGYPHLDSASHTLTLTLTPFFVSLSLFPLILSAAEAGPDLDGRLQPRREHVRLRVLLRLVAGRQRARPPAAAQDLRQVHPCRRRCHHARLSTPSAPSLSARLSPVR